MATGFVRGGPFVTFLLCDLYVILTCENSGKIAGN